MNRKLIGALALAWISTSVIAAPQSQPLDFKTLVVGAPATAQQVEDALLIPCGVGLGTGNVTCTVSAKKYQEMQRVKCGAGGNGMQICNGTTTIADQLTMVNLVIGTDGTIQRIHLTFIDLSYDDVHQALVAKFGAAQKVSHPTLQNGFGATFLQEESLWAGAKGAQLLLQKYAGDVDHSDAYFSTQADRDLMTGASQAPSTDL